MAGLIKTSLFKNRVILLISIILITSVPAFSESVFLKDGSILIDVSIVSDTAGSVTVKFKDKSFKTVPRSDIMRLLYTELKLGKIYVQKRDGEGVVAFLVDEDRTTYTFRKELYKPVEFTLNRADVLFMAEKNPSGLHAEGDIETDRVNLKWLPPYDPVKKYKIYIRKNKNDKFIEAETSSETMTTVDDLSSNTTYYLIVRAIDREENESEPSNELKITTKNIPPERPAGLKIAEKDDSGNITLKWDEAKDPDGTVKGYIIYKNDDDGVKPIGKSEKPEYTIPSGISVYDIEVSAFDELKSESERSGSYRSPSVIISILPMAFIPAGKIGEMYNPGYGFMMNIGLKNIPVQKLEFGISSSYAKPEGKKDLEVVSMTFIQETVYGGYHFYPVQWFSISPFVKGGISYSNTEYTGYSGIKKKTIIDPVAVGGISLNFGSDFFYFTAGFDYGIIYETSEIKPYYEAFAGCSLLFKL